MISTKHIPSGFSKAASFVMMMFTFLCLLQGEGITLDVPQPQGYVTDLADMISAPVEEKLARALQAFELTDSTQIAILTIPSLEGDSLEEFSIRTVEQWKIGQKGEDNGLLLLVAKEERKIRIEVGRGLEGIMTDLMAGRIIDQVISPLFKEGRLDEGFVSGINAIIQTTRGEFKTDQLPRRGRNNGQDSPPFFTYLIFAAFFIAFLGSNSRILGAVSGAIILPVIAMLGLPVSLGLFILLLIPIGAAAGLLLPLLLAGLSSHRRSGVYYGGGFGGSGGFSGGGGFGGFGGGGFGGGGASGGW